MKHIKQYESNIKDMYNLKPYFIYKAKFNYYIFEISKIYKYTVRTSMEYMLQDNKIQGPRELMELMNKTDYDFSPEEIEEHMIYNSNLTDCLTKLKTLTNPPNEEEKPNSRYIIYNPELEYPELEHEIKESVIQTEPKIGDYVICKETFGNENKIKFLNTNIGKIINIDRTNKNFYIVEYENIPKSLIQFFTLNNTNYNIDNTRTITRKEIIHFSPNKEDLLPYLYANKYNI
jgi:hypothetical protein